ncbi:MAG TPA: ZIP family metal transporter [Chloroflexia bacterium]|nr:ZIP family metal transporter [Chloroflexia bacterium]
MSTSPETLEIQPAHIPERVETAGTQRGLLTWVAALIPLGLLAAMLALLALTNPLALFTGDLPPIENLSVQRVQVMPDGFRFDVINGSPEDVTVAQVMVDDAFWNFHIEPSNTIPRLGTATVTMQYPWVEGEPHAISLVTSTGTTFGAEVAVAVETPTPGPREFFAYGLLGVYVGIIPVVLGMAWFPAMRRLGRRGLAVVLSLTVGLLVFLLIDTLLEAFEVSALLPEVYQGVPLVLFAALLTWLGINAVSTRGAKRNAEPAKQRLFVSTLIALSIGLHNLGEGLAIGAAFALGEAALGSFLVIGFTLHNITEGVGIAAPLTKDRPKLWQFLALALLAGAPASVGAWIGGFAYSPLLATIFLGIGVGAILQVIVEVGRLLLRDAEREGVPAINWANVGGLAAGIAVMYLTAFLVKF